MRKIRGIYFGYVLVFVISFVALILSYRYITNENKTMVLQASNQAYQQQINSAIDLYENFSHYIYSKIIDEEVLSIMQEANTATLNKTLLREELYTYLIEDYHLIQTYDFRQLHFHLTTGESFLRFHQPNQFGDNLLDVRASIRIANEEKRFVKGFEEGKIFNGYRFVYPLFLDDKHVGSVEVSISIATIMDMLYKLDSSNAYFFIMNRAVVENIVFDEFLTNYTESILSSNYLLDRAIFDAFLDRREILLENQLSDFVTEIAPKLTSLIDQGKNFSYPVVFRSDYYVLQFISIENINGQHVGYVFSIHKDKQFNDMITTDILVYITLGLVAISVFSVGLIYIIDKERKIRFSQTDPLTKLMNRNYFNKVANKEVEKASINGVPLTMVVADIDYFKKINDTYGHLKGDEVLAKVGEVIKQTIRKMDYAARWGGEEFSLLLLDTSISGAIEVIKRIQNALLEANLGIDEPIKMSYGIACISDDVMKLEVLFNLADQGLYKAKAAGRNRYMVSQPIKKEAF